MTLGLPMVWSFGGYIASSVTRILVWYLEANGSPESQKLSMTNVSGLFVYVVWATVGLWNNIQQAVTDTKTTAQVVDTTHHLLEEWTFANAATNVAHQNQSRSTIPRIATLTTSPVGLPSTLAAGDIHVCVTNSSPTPLILILLFLMK
ncbi:transmembrane protein, putative [Medicago truncatula]|uniref:Transmembrane protein, putative n=1 Tax=Medicago truncatula TaxID=3880 RepID=G7KU37_MEDTR|nr:transmembrane protein, putative [Medicago truncatula]